MSALNNFINNLIPDRFKLTYELKTKARGVIITQIIIGILLSFIGILLWVIDQNLTDLVLNTGIGIFLLAAIFTLRYFTKFESYVNLVLAVAYIVIGSFSLERGIYADAPFWFAILLAATILYTSTKHFIFWTVIVSFFISGLFYAQIHGLELNYVQVSYTKKAATLFTYFLLVIAVTRSFKQINKRKNLKHLEIIAQHKRLLKERDDLMSIIAHDMQSPSRRIEGLISIFGTDNLTKEQKEILNRLKKTANESKQLIDDLIEATSFQSSLTIEKTSINNIINELKTGFLPLASKKNIIIINRGLRNKLWVETSSYQLRRILDNLLSNAIKFSPHESRVEIICVQNSANTSISITDQGPGFNKEDEVKMFKMFQKLSARPTGDESSTGLGLSIVKSLTELLKGEIKYVTQVDKGSSFTLVLPNKFPQESINRKAQVLI